MNVKKTIKKVVALGAGAVLVGATILGAVATDLADYPEPFVKDGVYDAKIVVGADAATQDVVGAIDIAASLQAAAKEEIPMDGETTYSVADGYNFNEDDELILGQNTVYNKDKLDSDELTILEKDVELKDDDGDTTEYDVVVELDNVSSIKAGLETSYDMDEISDAPLLYYDIADNDFYSIKIEFDEAFELANDGDDKDSGLVDQEKITLFGNEYEFDSDNDIADKELTLFGSSNTVIVSLNEELSVPYEGNDYDVKVMGGNPEESTAIVRINDDTETVEEGDNTEIGGLPVHINDVFVNTLGDASLSVQLSVGSDELVLANGDELVKNGQDVDGVTVHTDDETFGNVRWIEFIVHPKDLDSEIEYINSGEEFVDPVFGAFKFKFVGSEDLTADKEYIGFEGDDPLSVTFTAKDAEEYTLSLLEDNSGSKFIPEIVDEDNLTNVSEDDIFILTEDEDSDDAMTYVFEITDISIDEWDNESSSDYEYNVEIVDLLRDETYTLDEDEEKIGDTDYKVTAMSNETVKIEDGAGPINYTNPVIVTENNAKITLGSEDNASFGNFADAPDNNMTFKFEEEIDTTELNELDSTEVVYITYKFDDEDGYLLKEITNATTSNLGDDDKDNKYYLSKMGTYIVEDTQDEAYTLDLYVPDKEVSYDMFVMPVSETVTTTSSGTTYDQVNEIGAGMAVLDTEVNAGDSNLVVVGGPCANSVAYDLMEPENACGEDFTQGKSLIKLFETSGDTMAILVAGYDAADTMAATDVLVNYEDHADVFEGKTEVEITTSSKEVTEVSEPEEDAEDDADEDTGDNETTE